MAFLAVVFIQGCGMTHGAPVVTGNQGGGVLGVPSDPRPRAPPKFLLSRSHERELYPGHLFVKMIHSLGNQSGLFKILCEDAETCTMDTAAIAPEILATSQ